jgi:NAD(P)-dependent dehydrogenase (short-subunit alcohol dehydrogenase family)
LGLGFAREGASLILTDVQASGLEETATLIRDSGGICITQPADLSSEAEIRAFAARVSAVCPAVHVLYNNAGIAYGEVTRPVESIDQAKWLTYLSVNSLAPLLLANALRPLLVAGKGCIINQSSMAAYMPTTIYGVTKATLNALTCGMAAGFGVDGVRVNAIAPGLMETPAASSALPAEAVARVRAMQLMNLEGQPDDIVNLALFLASDEARFITGEIVHCDAGNRIRGWRG